MTIPPSNSLISEKERTCYPHNRPPIPGREHGLKYSRHRGELHDAAYGRDREGGTKVEVKRMRDRRVQYYEGEANPDV